MESRNGSGGKKIIRFIWGLIIYPQQRFELALHKSVFISNLLETSQAPASGGFLFSISEEQQEQRS